MRNALSWLPCTDFCRTQTVTSLNTSRFDATKRFPEWKSAVSVTPCCWFCWFLFLLRIFRIFLWPVVVFFFCYFRYTFCCDKFSSYVRRWFVFFFLVWFFQKFSTWPTFISLQGKISSVVLLDNLMRNT